MKRLPLAILTACATLLSAATANAGPIMYVDFASGFLGTVDVETGDVVVIGDTGVFLTDIAFDPNGNLFGISFDDLYSIDPTTADATLIGSHGIAGANALVFGANGTLYGAGFETPSLFTIDPETGIATNIGDTGFLSAGDLAFNGGEFYLASFDEQGSAQLVRIDLTNVANSQFVGRFGVDDVFGLATGDDGRLYGVANDQVFLVDTATGLAANPVTYDSVFLGPAFGQSFRTEAAPLPVPVPVPEPTSLLLVGGGVVAATVRRRKGRARLGPAAE